MARDDRNLTRGYAFGVAAAIAFSTTAIFIRHLTETYRMPPLVLALWRDVFVTVTLVGALFALHRSLLRVDRRHLGFLAAYGLVLAVYNSVWTISVALNGAAVATVLVYSSSGFTALLGWRLLGERLGWVKVFAVTFSLCGCMLVSGATGGVVREARAIGVLTGVFSGLCYAGYSLMGRSAWRRGINPWTTLLYTFGFATGYLLAANALPGEILPGAAARPADIFWLGRAAAGWIALFLLGAGPTVFGFGLYNVSLTYLPSSVANLIVTLEPPFTAAIAYLVLGERLTAVQLWGSLFILAGVVFLRVYEGRLEGRVAARPQEAG